MSDPYVAGQIISDMIKSWGIDKPITSVDFHIEANKMPTITLVYEMPDEDAMGFTSVQEHFELKLKGESNE